MTKLKIILKAVAISFSIIGTAIAELPQITDARIVQPPPGSSVAAGYFTISNPADESLEITGAASNVAKKTEIHLSLVENDIAKMQKQSSIVIKSGESLDFTHGSFHIMFMGLNEELVAGDSLDITLLSSVGDIAVSLPVISLEDAMSRQGKDHQVGDSDHEMNHNKYHSGQDNSQ